MAAVREGTGTGWFARLRGRAGRADPSRSAPRRVAVVTDSAAGLPTAWLAPHGGGAVVVPIPVLIAGEEFREGHDDVATRLAIALASGTPVTTSRPGPGAFAVVYAELAAAGYESIVSIHLSGRLSGTVDAARIAAAQVRRERNVEVTVVDSRTAGLAEGYLVLDALQAAAAGAGAEAVAAAASPPRLPSIDFVVPSLEQLRRGGRISRAASVVGTMLAVKPLLSVQDGAIQARENPRTLARAVARLVDVARGEAEAVIASGRRPRIALHYFGAPEQAEEIRHELLDLADEDVQLVPLPAVLGAHTGIGVVAIVVA
ncbi:DegV family protein [Zhihengliuella sp.]|uniref:DegV family protein n=1 Tax=Zhihengliuella sp. TaxID=1954483 RepID=UPI0028119D48|nr:DegV family protein [Zhihengliuella sp.]